MGLRAVLADLRVYETFKAFRRARREETLAQRTLSGAAQQRRVRALAARRTALANRLGLEIRRRLRDVLVQLDAIKVKADEIGLEVELGEKTALEARRRALATGRHLRRAPARRAAKRSRSGGSGRLLWPAQSEYWLDEVGAFRSTLQSACPAPRRPSGAAPSAPRRGGP